VAATTSAPSPLSVSIHREVGNALGALEADAPRLAAKLLPLTGYSHVVLGALKAIDLYREVYGVTRVDVQSWRDGDEVRHRLDAPDVRPSLTPPAHVGPEWLIRRTTRLADVVRSPGVLRVVHEVVELCDGWCDERGVRPELLQIQQGFPKYIAGMQYVVTALETA
jgi:hypothetical protein